MKPFRVKFIPVVELQGEAEKQRLALNANRTIAEREKHGYPVAVVGGGPSLLNRLDELLAWPGDIWAINSTAGWLAQRGIDCTYYSADASEINTSVRRRLLASCCHPSLFTQDARMFHMCEHAPDGIPGGTTSATRAPMLALRLGYPGVHFFGCDSSFEDRDHVDRNENHPDRLIVRADGKTFQTRPDFLMQAENLAETIRMAPDVFVNRSDGLLDAMVRDDAWEIVAVSTSLKKHLIEVNGDSGIFDTPYVQNKPCESCGRTTGHYDDCEVGMGVI